MFQNSRLLFNCLQILFILTARLVACVPQQGSTKVINPFCLRSLELNADIRYLYPGEHWMSTGWKSNYTTWDEPQLCPDLSLVTEYGFIFTSEHEFFMTCTPAENIIESGASDRTAVTVRIPSRHFWPKYAILSTSKVTPFVTGFDPKLSIADLTQEFEILLQSFELTPPNSYHPYYSYSMDIYHINYIFADPWRTCPWANSSWSLRECPQGHAICGVTNALVARGFAELPTFAFKCCRICMPREKWAHLHTVINRSSKPYTHFDPVTSQTSSDMYNYHDKFNFKEYDPALNSKYMERFAPIFGPKAAQGFNWNWNSREPGHDFDPDLDQSLERKDNDKSRAEEGPYKGQKESAGAQNTWSCPPWTTCRYRTLVGLCGDNVVVKTQVFDMESSPLTFRDLFHCVVLNSEPFFYQMNTCVSPTLSTIFS